MKILGSKKLVTIFKREVDLDSLPKKIARYFYPVSLERARAVISLVMTYDKELSSVYDIEYTSYAINILSQKLSQHLIMAAKSYQEQLINHGDEKYVYEIYGKAILNLLKEDRKPLSYIERKKYPVRQG